MKQAVSAKQGEFLGIDQILEVDDKDIQRKIVLDILSSNGLLWEDTADRRIISERQVRQLKFLYGLTIFRPEVSKEQRSFLFDLAWDVIFMISENQLSQSLQESIRQEIKGKLVNTECAPNILLKAKQIFAFKSEEENKIKAGYNKRIDSFVGRLANGKVRLLKIKDPQIQEGMEFIDQEGLGLGEDRIAYATGSTFRKLDTKNKYKKPLGRETILDTARVDLKILREEGILISSIADGHMHGSDEQQNRQITDIANLGCKLANRELAQAINKYWKENQLSEEEKGYSFSPNLYRPVTGSSEPTSEYQDTVLHKTMKEIVLSMSKRRPRHNFEHAGITSYAAKIDGDGRIRVTGFSVGDQMLIAYSKEEGFRNVAPSIRLIGGPEFWNYEEDIIEQDKLCFVVFDQALPEGSIVIGLTDGVFDMLPEGFVRQEELGNYESFGREAANVFMESINTQEINKAFQGELNSAEEIKNWLLECVKEKIESKDNSEERDNPKAIGDDVTIVAVNIEKVIMKTGLLQRGVCKDSAYI
ncbi:hypothetical protein [Candidatus Jidaibacter acanthamoebae]|uniref:hypothetical protein n=1 Tax=Candidatus Jidaibacter acanthamoebae TaxID=86105 RepID=UPI00057DF72A|nr:hypothetical protein [Candidatus Jidaibacter acanthamoeba]